MDRFLRTIKPTTGDVIAITCAISYLIFVITWDHRRFKSTVFRFRFNLLQDQIWRLTIRCTIQLSLSAGSRILLSSRERKLPLSRTINSTIPELSFASSTTWCCRPFPSHGPQRIQRHEQFCTRVIPVHFQRNTLKDNSFRQCQCFHRRDQPVFTPDEKLLIIKKL